MNQGDMQECEGKEESYLWSKEIVTEEEVDDEDRIVRRATRSTRQWMEMTPETIRGGKKGDTQGCEGRKSPRTARGRKRTT